MIRATAGNWVNYATTLLAQVLFAYHFGSTTDAAAYTVSFALATSVSGVLLSVAQTVALPRLVTTAGGVRRALLAFLLKMTLGATVVGALAAVGAHPAAAQLGRVTGIPTTTLTPMLLTSAGVLVARFVAGEFELVAYGLGHRLLPSLAPAIPTLAIAGAFLVAPAVGAVSIFIVFLVASVLETILVGAVISSKIEVVGDPAAGVGRATFSLLWPNILLTLLAPLERLVVGIGHSADTARYDYSLRSLGAAQVLLTAGVAISSLASWSRGASEEQRPRLARSVATTVLLATYILVGSAAIFIAVGGDLVKLLYQHGEFSRADTAVVTRVILLALAGYCAQGISIIVVNALAAVRRTSDLVTIGLLQFGARISLLIPLGLLFGVEGVALSYSIGSVLALGVSVVFLVRAGLWRTPPRLLLCVTIVGSTALGGSLLVAETGGSWSQLGRLAGGAGILIAIAAWLPYIVRTTTISSLRFPKYD